MGERRISNYLNVHENYRKVNIINPYRFAEIGGGGWDLTNASYDSINKSISAEASAPYGLFFKSDGTSFYVLDSAAPDVIFQYNMSAAWNITTASYASKSLGVSTQDLSPKNIYFNSAGTTMYMAGDSNNRVYQYTLSTAWDISTGSYASKEYYVGAQEANMVGISFNSDESKMYIVGTYNGIVWQYTLSTPGDVSTASYASKSYNADSEMHDYIYGFFFKPDGTRMWISESYYSVHQYDLSTPWDVSTASYDNISLNASAQDSLTTAIFFKSDDGNKMYTVGISGKRVYQYDTP